MTTSNDDVNGGEQKEFEMLGQDTNKIFSALNASQEFVNGILKTVPSDVDSDADYWLLSDPSVSTTDMWQTEPLVEWKEFDTLREYYGAAAVSTPDPQTHPPNATKVPSANPTGR